MPPRQVNWLRIVLAALDFLLLNIGVVIAHWLRSEGHLPHLKVLAFYQDAWLAIAAAVFIFYVFGLYNRIWQHASADAIVTIASAVTVETLLVGLLLGIMRSEAFAPTTLVMVWLVWLTLIGGSRFAWRVVRVRIHMAGAPTNGDERRRVLIYGAGEAGAALARRIEHDRLGRAEVVGFLDDDPLRRNMIVRSAKVLGTGEGLAEVFRRTNADEVTIAIPSASGAELKRIVDLCRAADAPHLVLPSRLETMDAPVALSQLRDVEVTDLLSRDPTSFPIDTCGEYLRGKCVLVTGAGGSIGSEICRQAVRFAPRKMVLFGRGENRIHDIYRELRDRAPEMQFVPAIANFAMPGVADSVLAEHRPDVVFHAGAHKHVYLMETNVVEAVRNNVFGTQMLLRAAQAAGTETFVLISTDKAVAPTSVMGATKRLGELLAACERERSQPLRIITVRFGNVLGSNGSVLAIFERQLCAGQPLTITHAEATRYFMSCEEAALLVVEAGHQAHEAGTYLLDMGEPIRIRDLAGELVRLWGGDPGDEANYEFIGLFPGEKLHEDLTEEWEELEQASPYLLRVRGPLCGSYEGVVAAAHELRTAMETGNGDSVRRVLFDRLEALRPQTCAVDEGESCVEAEGPSVAEEAQS